MASETSYNKAGVDAKLATKADLPAGGSDGQALTKNGTTTAWTTINTGGTVSDASTTAKGVVQLAGDLAGSAAAPVLKSQLGVSGTVGSATQIPVISYNNKGLITAVSAVTAAGGGTGATISDSTTTTSTVWSSSKTASAIGAATSSGGAFNIFRPESYGATANGSTDDADAINACIAAASAAAGDSRPVMVMLQTGKTYRARPDAIFMKSNVTLDGNGAVIQQTGSNGIINSGNNPAVPAASDVTGQTAGAGITDNYGAGGVPYGIKIRNITFVNYRYAILTKCFSWPYSIYENLVFYDCNIGLFAYQGAQVYKMFNCYSTGSVGGTTFVGSATGFASGHPYGGGSNDNYFTDGFTYDGSGATNRDSCHLNATFDAWFKNAILRPTVASFGAGHTSGWVFPFTDSDTLGVSGRNIYIPQRNGRNTFSPIIRRLDSEQCDRGAVLIGNPIRCDIANVAGENMFVAGAAAMVVLTVSNGVPPTGILSNIDAQLVTNNSTWTVETRNGSSGGVGTTTGSLIGFQLIPGNSGKVNASGMYSLLTP